MKLAIPFKRHEKINEKADIYILEFDPNKNDFSKLIEFIQETDKRVEIHYSGINGLDAKTAAALSKVSDDVYFRLDSSDVLKVSKLRENKCKFYFTYPATDFFYLQDLVEGQGVSCVYIANELCFNLDAVRRYCDKHNVEIRMTLNSVPLTTHMVSKTIPFWRPQDVDLLDKYFDIAEFYCGEPYSFKKLDVLYRTYFEKKDWAENLQEIIPDLPFAIYNRSIVPSFTSKKINCGRKCVNKDSKCEKCNQYLTLANELVRIGAQIRP